MTAELIPICTPPHACCCVVVWDHLIWSLQLLVLHPPQYIVSCAQSSHLRVARPHKPRQADEPEAVTVTQQTLGPHLRHWWIGFGHPLRWFDLLAMKGSHAEMIKTPSATTFAFCVHIFTLVTRGEKGFCIYRISITTNRYLTLGLGLPYSLLIWLTCLERLKMAVGLAGLLWRGAVPADGESDPSSRSRSSAFSTGNPA